MTIGQTTKDRILMYLAATGMSQGKFEKKAGLSNGYITNLRKAPSAAMLQKIFKAFPELNSDWLITGEGDMLILSQDSHNITTSGDGNSIHQDNRQYFSDSPDVLRAQIEQLELLIQEKERRLVEKDEQIAKKDEQIASLIDALKSIR